MIINWIEYVKWDSLKNIADKVWQITENTLRNRIKKSNTWVIIVKWFVYIPVA